MVRQTGIPQLSICSDKCNELGFRKSLEIGNDEIGNKGHGQRGKVEGKEEGS